MKAWLVINTFMDTQKFKNLYEMLSLAFKKHDVDLEIKNRFFEVFNNESYPLIKIINEDNFDDVLKVSKDMRNNIRGQDIGELG